MLVEVAVEARDALIGPFDIRLDQESRASPRQRLAEFQQCLLRIEPAERALVRWKSLPLHRSPPEPVPIEGGLHDARERQRVHSLSHLRRVGKHFRVRNRQPVLHGQVVKQRLVQQRPAHLRARQQEAEVWLELITIPLNEGDFGVSDIEEDRSLLPRETQTLQPAKDFPLIARAQRRQHDPLADVTGRECDVVALRRGDDRGDSGYAQCPNDVVRAGPPAARYDDGRLSRLIPGSQHPIP